MLDYLCYPNLFNLILSCADDEALRGLRTTCSAILTHVDSLLFEHVIVTNELGRPSPVILLKPSGSRLPMDPASPDGLGFNAIRALQQAVVLDLLRSGAAYEAVLKRVPALRTLIAIKPPIWRFFVFPPRDGVLDRSPRGICARYFKAHTAIYFVPLMPIGSMESQILPTDMIETATRNVVNISFDPHDHRLFHCEMLDLFGVHRHLCSELVFIFFPNGTTGHIGGRDAPDHARYEAERKRNLVGALHAMMSLMIYWPSTQFTFVGLETMPRAALNLDPNLEWTTCKQELKKRLAILFQEWRERPATGIFRVRESETREHPHIFTHSECRTRVGEFQWLLETERATVARPPRRSRTRK